MWEYIMIGWGVVVGLTVFILFLRDPNASGIHPSQFEALLDGFRRRLDLACEQLCSLGLRLPNCAGSL